MKLWPAAIARDITFHRLRQSAVSLMRQAGVDAFIIARVVGHSSESMVEHYSHADAPVLLKGIEQFAVAMMKAIPAGHGYGVVTDVQHENLLLSAKEKPLSSSGVLVVELDGIEPTTSSLQSSRSPN